MLMELYIKCLLVYNLYKEKRNTNIYVYSIMIDLCNGNKWKLPSTCLPYAKGLSGL